MRVRSEELADRAGIQAVLAAAFPTRAEAELVDALRAAGRLSISRVAEDAGRVVGCIAFSPVTIEGRREVGLGLAPLAVAPEIQRRGIGQALVGEGLVAAKRAEVGFVVVLGDPGYYGRFGFRAAGEWGLRDEFGGGPVFQALELHAEAIPSGGGLVLYASEFNQVA